VSFFISLFLIINSNISCLSFNVWLKSKIEKLHLFKILFLAIFNFQRTKQENDFNWKNFSWISLWWLYWFFITWATMNEANCVWCRVRSLIICYPMQSASRLSQVISSATRAWVTWSGAIPHIYQSWCECFLFLLLFLHGWSVISCSVRRACCNSCRARPEREWCGVVQYHTHISILMWVFLILVVIVA
jgi:hypothetical protein